MLIGLVDFVNKDQIIYWLGDKDKVVKDNAYER
jgi:hypothetical protein